MDSILNSNISLDMQAEDLEQIKHKIWSPVPHKLRKVEDSISSSKSLIVKRSDSCTSTSSQFKRPPLQTFNPKNSAFRSIFIKNNKLNPLELASSNSSVFPSEKSSPLADEFTPSDKSGMEIEVPPTLFRRTVSEHTQTRLPETPKFRVSIHNPLREVPLNTAKPVSISDFFTKAQTPFGESFLPKEYLQLFSALSANNSACESPTIPIKEESKHKCERHNNSHGNNENANANTSSGNNENKIVTFMKPDQNKKKTRHCNCKNSKCLKLYCECLAYGEYCDDSCNCCDCHNTTQKEEVRNYALSLIAEKKPEILEGGNIKQKSSKIVRGKGCNCKKSACQKKYCECYNSAGGCGPHCKCEGCKNPYGVQTENGDSESSPISMDIVQELGLSFKKVALSDKSTGGNVKKNRIIQGNLSLFGREAGEMSNAKAPLTLPSLL